jgi:hypothetical protein
LNIQFTRQAAGWQLESGLSSSDILNLNTTGAFANFLH